ncbi:hypothetical protein TeGR_g2937, partial [Tetraparma gracilis]
MFLQSSKVLPHLLSNLDVLSVPSTLDEHPLTVYRSNKARAPKATTPVLLLHGRTWSSLPVYNLTPEPTLEAFPPEYAV